MVGIDGFDLKYGWPQLSSYEYSVLFAIVGNPIGNPVFGIPTSRFVNVFQLYPSCYLSGFGGYYRNPGTFPDICVYLPFDVFQFIEILYRAGFIVYFQKTGVLKGMRIQKTKL